MADGPQRARLPIPPTEALPSCLWSRRIVPSLPGSRLKNFYRDTSSALFQLANQWLNLTCSRSHAFLSFPLRKPEYEFWFSHKNLTHDSRVIYSSCRLRGYHSGD